MTSINRAIPPEIQPIEAFALAKPRRDVLSNSIPVFYFDNPYLDLIHILLQVRTGSMYQPEKHVCNFAFSLLRESSAQFSPQEMSEKLDYYGTNVTVNVGLECVQILISVPKNNISEIVPAVADFITFPEYRTENLRIMQDKEIKNLAYNVQKTDYCSWRIMWREMLGGLFPTVSEFATADTINNLTTSKLKEYHSECFCAENVSIFVTGNLDSHMEDVIRKAWEPIPNGTPSPALPEIPMSVNSGRLFYEPMRNCMQSSIVLCRLSTGYNDNDRTAFSVLNTLTGGYFSSRLMQNLRERQGLTYGISSSSTYFGKQSIFAINSDVNADRTQEALDSCFEELQRLQEKMVSDEELLMVKNYMAGIQLRAADTTVNAMQKFAYWHRFGLDETEMFRYLTNIKKVTPEDIHSLAKKYFSHNNFTQIIVGHYFANKKNE